GLAETQARVAVVRPVLRHRRVVAVTDARRALDAATRRAGDADRQRVLRRARRDADRDAVVLERLARPRLAQERDELVEEVAAVVVVGTERVEVVFDVPDTEARFE